MNEFLSICNGTQPVTRLYVCPGLYVMEDLPMPWVPGKSWIMDEHGNYHTDDVHVFASMVKQLKQFHIQYTVARLSFVPSHIV